MDYYDIQIRNIIDRALEEDLGWGDVTTDYLILPQTRATGTIVSRCTGVVAGMDVARAVFQRVDPDLQVQVLIIDGEEMHPDDVLGVVTGKAAGMMRAERVALNFLQRMCGIATRTAQYVSAVHDYPVRIADTRKTVPGLRVLDKHAVRVGGGMNHRMHLGDGVLIKDNHLAVLRAQGMTLREVVSKMRQNSPRILTVEIEAATVEEARDAVEAGADIVLLDNMDKEGWQRSVEAIKGRALIEASGGMNIGNATRAAEAGVDFISVGSLTHSVEAMDISLDIKAL